MGPNEGRKGRRGACQGVGSAATRRCCRRTNEPRTLLVRGPGTSAPRSPLSAADSQRGLPRRPSSERRGRQRMHISQETVVGAIRSRMVGEQAAGVKPRASPQPKRNPDDPVCRDMRTQLGCPSSQGPTADGWSGRSRVPAAARSRMGEYQQPAWAPRDPSVGARSTRSHLVSPPVLRGRFHGPAQRSRSPGPRASSPASGQVMSVRGSGRRRARRARAAPADPADSTVGDPRSDLTLAATAVRGAGRTSERGVPASESPPSARGVA